MTARKGSAIPIWFSVSERQSLEEGAALAGYKHLSTYIKDRVFARGDFRVSPGLSPSSLDQDVDLATRLDLLLADQAFEKAMLAFVVSVLVRDMSPSNKLEMVRRFSAIHSEEDVFESLGEVGAVIRRFAEEIE
jgi:hypothetical protein